MYLFFAPNYPGLQREISVQIELECLITSFPVAANVNCENDFVLIIPRNQKHSSVKFNDYKCFLGAHGFLDSLMSGDLNAKATLLATPFSQHSASLNDARS